MYKRIAIIGISGVGKSWLARRLSQKLGLPIVHYDTLCWDKNWTEVAEAEIKKRILDAIDTDGWILEGYINPAAQERLRAADIVLYLDYSGWRSVWGGLRRWWQHRKIPRPELAEGCEDRWSWERFRIMWTRDERREIEGEVKEFSHKVLRIFSPNELEQFIKGLE